MVDSGRAKLASTRLRRGHRAGDGRPRHSNVAITHVSRARRQVAQRAMSLDELVASDAGALEHRLVSRDLLARIHALLEALDPRDRQVMLLYLEGLPQREIAEVCGISEANVSTKVHRMRQLLSAATSNDPEARHAAK